MNKLTLLCALLAAAALTGCGKKEDTSTASSSSSTTAPAPAPAPAPPPAAAPDPAAAASAAAVAPGATASAGTSGSSGQVVFTNTCAVCHAAGVGGAPKPGDKADWGPRIAQGKDTLYQHAIAGYTGKKGVMPPKGGNTALPDTDVKAAVDYMVSLAQ